MSVKDAVDAAVAEWKSQHPLSGDGDNEMGWIHDGVDEVASLIVAKLEAAE